MESSHNTVEMIYKNVMPDIVFPSGNWPIGVPWFRSDAPNEHRISKPGSLQVPRCCCWWKSDSVAALPSGPSRSCQVMFCSVI